MLNIYESSGDEAGIMNIIAKAFKAIDTLNAARLTTVPDKIKAYIDRYKLKETTLATDQILDGVALSSGSWAASGFVVTSTLIASIQQFLIDEIGEEFPAATGTLFDALQRFADEMVEQDYKVESSSVSASLVADSGNTGDSAIAYTLIRGDGKTEMNAIAEDITVETVITGTNPSLVFSGEQAVTDRVRETWPAGSGGSLSLTPGNGGLVSNGDFEAAAVTDLPDDWALIAGTAGTTIGLTPLEVQNVVMSGTPTGGSYWLRWSDGTSTHTTLELTYDAGSSAVQSALRTVPGLGAVTVDTTGDSPNYTHAITFDGAAGDPAQLTSATALLGGTAAGLTHSTVTSGVAGSYTGRSLKMTGYYSGSTANEQVHFILYGATSGKFTISTTGSSSVEINIGAGSVASQLDAAYDTVYPGRTVAIDVVPSGPYTGEYRATFTPAAANESDVVVVNSVVSPPNGTNPVTAIRRVDGNPGTSTNSQLIQPIALATRTSYLFHVRLRAESSIFAGTIRFALLDGVGGNVTTDEEGNANSLTVNCSSLSTSAHSSHFARFAIKATQTDQVYLQILITNVTNGKTVYIDDVEIIEATQFYNGGPWLAVFPGRSSPTETDNWTLTIANNRAGSLQEWFARTFDTPDFDILLPVTGSTAATTIPDSIIS